TNAKPTTSSPSPASPAPSSATADSPNEMASKGWNRRVLALHRDRHAPATDPYFDVRLWLQTETRHGWVWAYNLEHLDLIRRFVQAPLREGIPWHKPGGKMTVVARLPGWMQQARNRDEVLRAIARIHASLLRA
ncbi:hypothetical protein AB0L54_22245, partial [Streptomyces sp. NPDC052196]